MSETPKYDKQLLRAVGMDSTGAIVVPLDDQVKRLRELREDYALPEALAIIAELQEELRCALQRSLAMQVRYEDKTGKLEAALAVAEAALRVIAERDTIQPDASDALAVALAGRALEQIAALKAEP